MCEETEEVSSKPGIEDSYIESPSQDQANYLLSRKFVAFLIVIFIGLIGFIIIYAQTKEFKSYEHFLDFLLWSLVAYTGGNSLGKLTQKMVKK